MTELPVVFDCDGDALVGVVSCPDKPGETGVIIIVGGPQYRIGSHRQFVQLARSLAGAGHTALRFDLRGMGDSEGLPRKFYFVSRDIACAIGELLRVQPSVRRVVLWGLCGGASAALLYLRETADARVQGLVLVNPWVRSEVTQARTRVKHYYLQRLASPGFWKKLASGGVAWRALAEFTGNVKRALRPAQDGVATEAAAGQPEEARRPPHYLMAQAWAAFAGPTLLILSGNDFTAQEFVEATSADPRWRRALAQPSVTRLDIEQADHTFSLPAWQSLVESRTVSWLAGVGLPRPR
jgi:exosortase A-associated hydrolase 1